MSAESVFWSLLIVFVCLSMLGVLGAGIWLTVRLVRSSPAKQTSEHSETRLIVENVDPAKRRLNLLMAGARKATGESACCKCRYWDHDSGQLVIMQNPVFAAVTRQLKPSQMCKNLVAVEQTGSQETSVADPDAFEPPEHLDTWDLFGLCTKREECRHAMHKCSNFAPVQP